MSDVTTAPTTPPPCNETKAEPSRPIKIIRHRVRAPLSPRRLVKKTPATLPFAKNQLEMIIKTLRESDASDTPLLACAENIERVISDHTWDVVLSEDELIERERSARVKYAEDQETLRTKYAEDEKTKRRKLEMVHETRLKVYGDLSPEKVLELFERDFYRPSPTQTMQSKKQ